MKYADFDAAAFVPARNADIATAYLPALDLSVIDAAMDKTLEVLLDGAKRRVCFLNAHCSNVMRADWRYEMALRSADMILPDGIGIELAAKMTGQRLTANLNGTDLVPALAARAAKLGKSIFLLGGTPGTAEAAAAKLVADNPGLKIAGMLDGFEGAADEDKAVDAINATGADILLVAMGVPVQDLWIHRNAVRLTPSLAMGVGACFDFLAGNVARAPQMVRKAKAEWAWRLAMEPRRMAKRYLVGNFSFMAHAAKRAVKQISGDAVARRALDVTVAGGALLALAPLFAITALAIKADSPGPVFFKQTRVGKNGKDFTMFKFRSMGVDAEARRAALLANSDREGICFKSKADPRITRVGRFIRRFSIDELPQILNVLRGEMSIVGPRPALPVEVAQYPEHALGRLAVNPGITGVWQVSGRAEIGFDQMIDMDLAYAKSRSIMLDVLLILMTFRAVITARGAH